MKKKRMKLEGWDADFRRYKILVKIFRSNRVEQQNLEIFTTGLEQLLELRRLHALTFSDPEDVDIKELAKNN